jgi:hypothetical protein
MINDSQFIDLIEQNPVIWNRKSKEFRNLSHRLETWEKVALICGTNCKCIQKKIILAIIIPNPLITFIQLR